MKNWVSYCRNEHQWWLPMNLRWWIQTLPYVMNSNSTSGDELKLYLSCFRNQLEEWGETRCFVPMVPDVSGPLRPFIPDISTFSYKWSVTLCKRSKLTLLVSSSLTFSLERYFHLTHMQLTEEDENGSFVPKWTLKSMVL